MKCPYCDNDMLLGVIQSRDSQLYWHHGERYFLDDKAIPLSSFRFFTGATLVAHHCQICEKIVIDYADGGSIYKRRRFKAMKKRRKPAESNALYVSDLDGTLLDCNAELSEFTKNSINEMTARGLKFSIATARTWATAAKILDGLTLNHPVVLMNGVLVYEPTAGKYLQINRLEPASVTAICETLQQFNLSGLMYELRDGKLTTYYESLETQALRDFVDERAGKYFKEFVHVEAFSELPFDDIIYFTMMEPYERLEPVRAALEALPNVSVAFYKDNYSEDLWLLEAFSGVASKRSGIEALRNCGYGGIVCFGDNLNDLPMFEASDIRIAVATAKDEVRAAANIVCGANDEDGVAKWLKENAPLNK